MNKKIILITTIAGLLCFSGTFAFAWITKPVPQEAETPVKSPEEPNESKLKLTHVDVPEILSNEQQQDGMKKTMTEKQLQSLIYEVRGKIQEYEQKLANLGTQEQQLQAAKTALAKDIEKLDKLRIDLASTVLQLKTEQENLQKSSIKIAAIEKNNLISIAATYDKMDSTSAGAILVNMFQNRDNNTNSNDAVKILYYMTERTRAKVLASVAEIEPAISAYFCQKLKQISEQE